MKASNLAILSIIVVFIASCSTIRVNSDYISQTDFNQYKTYQIIQPDGDFPVGINPINQQRIETAIKTTLTDCGYHYADEHPDLQVAYFVKIDTEHAYNSYTSYYGVRWRGVTTTEVDIWERREGTLVIDLIDTRTEKVVWHGTATDTITENSKNIERKINDAVAAIFNQYVSQTALASR